MGNARWTGVRVKDVLDRAGVKSGALHVRFKGLDEPPVPDAPTFGKSLAIDHACDGEVMIAFAMNGEQLPLLNGLPLRLVVPGWYSTYWVKMLSDIEVMDKPDDNYWMAVAYTIPDTPHANIAPGQSGVKMIPINRMPPVPISRRAPLCLQKRVCRCTALPSVAIRASPRSRFPPIAVNHGRRPRSARITASTASAAGKLMYCCPRRARN